MDRKPLTRRLADRRAAAKGRRALAHALDTAPTQESRHELLALASR